MDATRNSNRTRVIAILSIVAVIAMCGFIFFMSARPADESDAMSLGIVGRIIGFIIPGYDQMSAADQLYWQQTLNYPVRKTAHFLEYAALGALMLNMIVQVTRAQGRNPRAVLKRLAAEAWALSTIYAATDEVHQLFVSGRTGKPTDVLIDSAGVLVGVLFVALIVHVVYKRKRRRASRS